jgi:hypothetical protein
MTFPRVKARGPIEAWTSSASRLRTDGALYDFPIEVLSEADQQYVQDLSAMAARAPKRLLEHDPPDRATIVQGP